MVNICAECTDDNRIICAILAVDIFNDRQLFHEGEWKFDSMNVSLDGTSIRRDVAATVVSSIRPGMSRTSVVIGGVFD